AACDVERIARNCTTSTFAGFLPQKRSLRFSVIKPRAWSMLATLNLPAEAGIADSKTRSNWPDSNRCEGTKCVNNRCQSFTRVEKATVTMLPPAEIFKAEMAR